jgi:hypothetical protein
MVNTTKIGRSKSKIIKGRALEQNLGDANKPDHARVTSRDGSELGPRMALVKIETNLRPEEIAVAAYYKAERRGFVSGGEVEDWLEAEKEMSGLARRK